MHRLWSSRSLLPLWCQPCRIACMYSKCTHLHIVHIRMKKFQLFILRKFSEEEINLLTETYMAKIPTTAKVHI